MPSNNKEKHVTLPCRVITGLYDTIETLKEKLDTVTRERDMYQRCYKNVIRSISEDNNSVESR